MNKKLIYALFVATLAVFGCSKAPDMDEQVGSVALGVDVDSTIGSTVTKSQSEQITVQDLTLYIINSGLDTVATYQDPTTMPESIELKVGDYTAICESANINDPAGFDNRSYRGTTDFSVAFNKTTAAAVVVKIADLLVDVSYSDRFKTIVADYDLTLTSDLGETLFVASDETRTANIKIGSKLSYTLRITNDRGVDVAYVKEIDGLLPADNLKLAFDISEEGDQSNNSSLRLTVDMTLNEFTHTYEMLLNPGDAPTVVPVNFNIGQDIVVNDEEDPLAKVKVSASNTIYGVYLNTNTTFLTDAGLPSKMNLLTLTDQQKSTLAEMGLSVIDDTTGAYPARDPSNVVIDFADFAKRLGEGRHIYDVSVLDVKHLSSNLIFNFDVSGAAFKMLSANSYEIYRSESNSAKAVIVGNYTSTSAPEGLTFQYKLSGTDSWVTIDHSDISIDTVLKQFTATTFVPENSTMAIRSVTVVDDKINYGAGELQLSTPAIPRITGLAFDDWANSGSTWYPNPTASNSWWATGNEGICASPLNMDANTTPEDDLVIKGRAVKMKSVSIGFILSPVKFAAGNIFLGTYKTNMSEPIESVKMGREFTGRPDQLKGYYYYQPADYNGGKDYCHIYISLENRSNGTKVIGYGELKDNRTSMTGYEPFTIDVNYTSTDPVTHVTIIATSSVDGANFNGGVGSLLYVDEFEIVYNGK